MEVLIDGVRYIPEPPKVSDASLIEQVLASPIEYELGKQTIRDYLYNLLKKLWNEGEGFSSKRPFGNSGWEYDLLYALVHAGFIEAEIEDGEIIDIPKHEESKGNRLIFDAISYVFYPQTPTK